jgi:RNase P/RNase MRP subunit p29
VDTFIVPEEDRHLVLAEDEREIEVPGEVRLIEVESDGTAG